MSQKDFLEMQKELPKPKKTKTAKINATYSYKYADLEDVLDAVMPVVHKFGFIITHEYQWRDGFQFLVTYLKKDDYSLAGQVKIPDWTDPKDFGTDTTYLRRYSICNLLGIVSEEDTDGVKSASKQKTTGANSSVPASTQQSKPAALPNKAPVGTSFGEYMMPLGKYKGVKLKDMKRNDLSSWLDYMMSQDKVTPQVEEAMNMAEAFLKTPLAPKLPEFNPLDEIPF